MHIATWNVNSIRARLPIVLDWLHANEPDILLLQETKGEAETFPALDFQALGYQSHVVGQKSYNGVALISRHPVTDLMISLPGDKDDAHARYIEGTVHDLRVASLYLPNGNPLGSDKYAYKLAWMSRLKSRMDELLKTERAVILGGDFNVIPEPEDVYAPQAWEGDALYALETRKAFRELIHSGYTDAFRALHAHETEAYTFWDYQAGAWQKNEGLRIDHFLLSPEAVDRLASCIIDKKPRALEKASDHTPVVLSLL
jgi:exodeoxyribonuclease-3